ncbi:hypothetical protein BC830DRAFT_1232252 [Chytriomyces sp. MP71]|nr:hypothetical protein BC830DRAFT_1232252 [Chytriomyces sp. MP71]
MLCLPRFLVPSLARGTLPLRMQRAAIACTWCRGSPELRDDVRQLSATPSSPRMCLVSPHTKLAVSILKSARKRFAEIASRLESGLDRAVMDLQVGVDRISLDDMHKPVDVAIHFLVFSCLHMNRVHSAMILEDAVLGGRNMTFYLFKNALRANVRITLPAPRAAVALYDPDSEPAQARQSDIVLRRREFEDLRGMRKLRAKDFGDFDEEALMTCLGWNL